MTVARFAGSVRSATGTVKTRAVSFGSTTPTGLGSRHQPRTGVTTKPLTGM